MDPEKNATQNDDGQDVVTKSATATDDANGDAADKLVDTLESLAKSNDTMNERMDKLEKSIEDASKVQYPYGVPGNPSKVAAFRDGEDPLTSRPYSMMKLAKSMAAKAGNESNWRSYAKVEHELSDELRKAFGQSMGWNGRIGGSAFVPLGSDLLPMESQDIVDEEGKTQKVDGLPRGLVRKCRDLMKGSMTGYDPDEFDYLQKRGVIPVRKDLSWDTSTSGAELVALAAEGELFEQLKGMEVFSQVGATQIDMPPQGSIRFPSQTGSVTIYAVTEGDAITESTPSTSSLTLTANAYSGLVDVPDELLRFATSVSVEAWLRQQFLQDLALKTDSDMIDGDGSDKIKGVVAYGSIRTVIASTTGGAGDTLEPQDPTRLFADIADQNAPVDRGFFYACTHTLWGGLSTKRADAVSAADAAGPFVFSAQTQSLGGSKPMKSLNGYQVVCSTQIPTDRSKGTASDLTLLLGGVPSEWIIARSGVAEIVMTNSDQDKFTKRINTMRGTVYMDAGPRHEVSFGMIDDLLNQ